MLRDMEGITRILLLCLVGFTHANTSPTINALVYQVCEDTSIGSHAFTIHATDAENDPLTYSVTGPNAAYFSVDQNTGGVSVKRQLDREQSNVMSLDVSVSDGLNVIRITLTLIVLDANDNKPIFQQLSYDIEIPESTPVGTTLFRALASDEDSGTAGAIQYSIDEVTPNDGFGLFSIERTTGEVRLSGNLNFNALSTFYRLKIRATDGGGRCFHEETNFHSSVASAFVTVVDVPDLDPLFVGAPYVGQVAENIPVGQAVLKVTAIDQDTGVNDYIIYSIEDSTVGGLFTISATGGVISVVQNINKELIGDTVTLTVKATESKTNIHGVHASATANVQIRIIGNKENRANIKDSEDKGSKNQQDTFKSDFKP